MPGKVNPVIPEAVTMVAAQVIGNDATLTAAALNGNLDLNVMMPVMAYNIIESVELIGNASRLFAEKCVAGLRANVDICRQYAERTAALVTAIAPAIGYDRAAALYKQALSEQKPIREVIIASGAMTPEQLDKVLDLERLTRGGRAGGV
jgi:fumarate hydratase class II